jgi:predicted RNA-binding protein
MTDSRAYWLVVFTEKTWAEALAAGGNIVGFRSASRNNFEKIAVGDYLLCYLTGISRFVAVQEVVSEPFLDDTPVWKDDVFPYRVMAKTITQLKPDTAVPVKELAPRLSIFNKFILPGNWGVFFRTSPRKWNKEDGQIVVDAIQRAAKERGGSR